MASEEVKATIHECDGCGRRFTQTEYDELPWGYHGHVSHIGAHGGSGGSFFACRESCIKRAVVTAEDRDD